MKESDRAEARVENFKAEQGISIVSGVEQFKAEQGKGSLQIEFLEKFGISAQLRGGGLPIPNFYPIFPEQTLLW